MMRFMIVACMKDVRTAWACKQATCKGWACSKAVVVNETAPKFF